MKRLALTCIAALALTAASAKADTPSTSVQKRAVQAAINYWHGSPTDGCNGAAPTIKYLPLDKSIGGLAFIGVCSIEINTAVTWWFSDVHWEYLCDVMLHEWGHLMLGDTPFIRTNPMDPNHSPNRYSVMYGGDNYDLLHVPACRSLELR